jgi:hypothetical protein
MARATPRTKLIVILAYLGCLLYAWAEMERLYHGNWDLDKTPLVLAAQQGDYVSALQLLESGEDPNQQPDGWGPTPLLMSIAMGDIPMIDLLLHSGGADIEKWGQLDPSGAEVLPLDYACMYRGRGRVGVVIFLLMSGADIDGSGIHTCENHYNQNIMDIKHVAQDWKAEGRSIEAEFLVFVWEVFHVVFHGYDADFDWDHGLLGLLQELETRGSASEI